MLVATTGLGLNFDVGPAPSFDVGSDPSSPAPRQNVANALQAQLDFTRTLVQNVATQLDKKALTIGVVTGVIGTVGLILGALALKRR